MKIRSAVFCFLILSACGSLPGVEWPDVVQCGSREADDLLPEVSTILLDDVGTTLGPVGKHRLEQLAIDHGAGVVACLVDRLVQRWTAPGATTSPERSDAVQRAQAWQTETGTQIEPVTP